MSTIEIHEGIPYQPKQPWLASDTWSQNTAETRGVSLTPQIMGGSLAKHGLLIFVWYEMFY